MVPLTLSADTFHKFCMKILCSNTAILSSTQEIEAAGVELTLPSNASRLKLFTVTISDCGLLTPDITPLYVFFPRKVPVGGFPPPPGAVAAAEAVVATTANPDIPTPSVVARLNDDAANIAQLKNSQHEDEDDSTSAGAKAQPQRVHSPVTPLGTEAGSETITFRNTRRSQHHTGSDADAPVRVSRDAGPSACTEEEFSMLRRALHDIISTIPAQQV